MILNSQDLKISHTKTMKCIYNFLEVRQVDAPEFKMIHSLSYRLISWIISMLLKLLYHRDTRRWEQILGRDCKDGVSGRKPG